MTTRLPSTIDNAFPRRWRVAPLLFAPLCCGWLLASDALADAPAPEVVEFNRDVRPLLADNCFACHGPDKNQRQAGLRLDRREDAFARRDDGASPPVLVPGKPAASELYRRLTAADAADRMPPPESGKTLGQRQIELIRLWIEQGARYEAHWSLLPPTRPPVPDVDDARPGDHPIDAFVVAALNVQQLQPAPEADRRTLIRRLSFDLTGLPPSPGVVDAFVAANRPEAYAELVERLLASPHYGERMAMYWLDVVRYADTNGIHGDNHRDVALFRDYVIDSFNDNKPFDRFTLEQIAGDLLPGSTMADKVASGYNRLLMTTREGGAQPKEYLAKYAADRVRNTATAWMGATLGCAECHDHKFDPYSTKDFYSFASFFADLQETAVGVQQPTRIPAPEQAAKLAQIDKDIAALRRTLDTQTPELDAALERWEESRRRGVVWSVLWPSQVETRDGTRLEVLDDGSLRAAGEKPDKDAYTVRVKTHQRGITAFRLEVLRDDSLPAGGPGCADNGNFVVGEVTLEADGVPIDWSSVTASHSQKNHEVRRAADGKKDTGWAILEQAGRDHHAVFETRATLGDGRGLNLEFRIEQNHGSRHTLGRFRLAATSSPRPIRATGAGIPDDVAAVLALEPGKRSLEQKGILSKYYRSIAPLLEPLRNEIAALERERQSLEKALPTTLVSTAVEPRVMRVLPRGNWLDDSGEIVAPAVPAFMKQIDVAGRRATRLDLASWLVSPDHPMVSRVFVNRLWKLFFGRGIVKTLDDFGMQGSWPTHPRLLDWLASEFVASGWDVKHMVKLLVTSHTYKQSSTATEALRRRDPYNRWLARQGSYRLDAEVVRDNALAASGLLSRRIGGPSVKPYQPAGYWAHLNFPKRVYKKDSGENLYRRGLYTYWARTFLHPSLLAFDAPTREESCVERPRSNTPLQALVLLNDPAFVEAARVLAEQLMERGGRTVQQRIRFAMRRVLQREPRATESKLLAALHADHLEQYRADSKAAAALLAVGDRPPRAGLDAAELAAWTSVTRVIFNLHETITRY